MAKRKGSSAPSCSRTRKKVDNDATDVESAHEKRLLERLLGKRHEDRRSERSLLDKLPPEVWEKILDELDENDLFPLALSCRYFRQKQKELVARKTRQSGPESDDSRRALKTNLRQKLEKGQPASADYLWFCRKEKVPKNAGTLKAHYTRCLAAFHGHLSLLQKLLKPLKKLPSCFKEYAGESYVFQNSPSLFWRLTSFSFSLLHSARRPSGNIEVAQEQGLPFG